MKRIRNRITRHFKIRKKVQGTAIRPRLAVFRSNVHIYGQVIDDSKSQTLISSSDLKLGTNGKRTDVSFEVGKEIAKKCLNLGIKTVVFDRGGFAYHGRVKRLAEGAREGGLKF